MATEVEETTELTGLEKAMARVTDLFKAKPKMVMPPGDDDDEEDEAPPSIEDKVKAAAPKKGAPPGGPAAPDDADGDGTPDEEDDDADGDGVPDGGEPDDDDDEDDPDDDQDDDDEGATPDAKLRRQVLRRSLANPDFFKSLLDGDDEMAQQVAAQVDASEVVGYIVSTFSEKLAEAHQHNAQLAKSFDGATKRIAGLEQAQVVILGALEKSLTLQDAIIKAMGDQTSLLKSIGSQPDGKTHSGLASLGFPAKVEPGEDIIKSEEQDDLPPEHKVRNALMVAGSQGVVSRERAADLMSMLNSRGVAVVMKSLEKNTGFQALLK